MRLTFLLVLASWVICVFVPSDCAEWYVDDSVSESGDGRSWEKAFKRIQQGIDEASEGDTVVVGEDTYVENIHFDGKDIVLRSTDPSDPSVVASTIIDGAQAGSVVTFSGTESESCVISGFTIRNGKGSPGGGIRGTILENETRATIRNNVITGNSAYGSGGGIANCRGLIENNVIADNSGGGLYDCDGTIRNNRISENSGGLYACDGTIENNTISWNSASSGGGLYYCKGIIRNNVITNNTADWRGGGLCDCRSIVNNTIVGNSAPQGGAMANCKYEIANSIIWDNGLGYQLHSCATPRYSCVQGCTSSESRNINLDPQFVDPENEDFHLQSWSPCIDAGDPTSSYSNEPPPNGGRVNMGGYGNTPEAVSKSPDMDADSLPDEWELHWFGDLEENGSTDHDGDGIRNVTEYRYGWNPTMAAETVVENQTKLEGYQTIQAALQESESGEQIVVPPGVYSEAIVFGGKNVVLRSTDPSDPAVVASTIIDANGDNPVVTFSGTEDQTCVLSGFTIRNGLSRELDGAGICGGTGDRHTHATIQNNIITEHSTDYYSGGGIAYCDGPISSNTIKDNSAHKNGGGLYKCNGLIANNTIRGNVADENGGGLFACGGRISHNVIAANSAALHGGGLCECDGLIEGNVIVGNSAGVGGGLYNCAGMIQGNKIINNLTKNDGGGASGLTGTVCRNVIAGNVAEGGWGYGGGLSYCEGAIRNNLIVGNWAARISGGIYRDKGPILNNTIARNSAGLRGGAIGECRGIVANCIIWGNAAPDGPQVHDSVVPTFCCIQGWGLGGEGNTAEDPLFVGSPLSARQWTEDAVFNEETWQTTLSDTVASWQPDAFEGLLINPNTTQPLQFLIVSNTATTIKVWGDASEFASAGDTYEAYGYHVDPTSPCIDTGDNTIDAGRFDLDGNYRRICSTGRPGWAVRLDYFGMQASGTFTLIWKGFIDIGAYECQVVGEVPETFMVHTREEMDSGDWTEVFRGNVPMWTDHLATGKQKFYRIAMEWPGL